MRISSCSLLNSQTLCTTSRFLAITANGFAGRRFSFLTVPLLPHLMHRSKDEILRFPSLLRFRLRKSLFLLSCNCIRTFHVYRSIRSFDQINFRSAHITTNRLRIVSSAFRIVIFCLTFRTHRKFFILVRSLSYGRASRIVNATTTRTINKRM